MPNRYRFFLLAFALLAAQPAAGQLTLTSSFFQNQVGNSYEMSQHLTTDGAQLQSVAEAEGADQTYDFTTAAYETSYVGRATYHGSGAGLPGGDELDDVNYAVELEFSIGTEDSTAYVFGSVEEDAVYTHGAAFVFYNPETERRDTMTIAYEPPQKNFELPLEFGAEWTDTTSLFGEVITTKRVDGYGTLVTPDGSAEALRIWTRQEQESGGISFTSYSLEFVTATGLSARIDLGEDGETVASGQYTHTSAGSVARERSEVPDRIRLDANYPNPFNPSTQITYRLDAPARVTLTVHDAVGRRVATLVQTTQSAGRHQVAFDAAALPSGTYFYRLQAGGVVETRTMTLTK